MSVAGSVPSEVQVRWDWSLEDDTIALSVMSYVFIPDGLLL